jgi:integrase/recombinase XerD
MLEHYYVRPAKVDQIRSLWLGPAISRYAEWLAEQQTKHASVMFRLQTAVRFDGFVAARHVRSFEDLPDQIEPFIEEWRRTRGGKTRSRSHRRWLAVGPRNCLEQLLRVAVPGFVGSTRRQPWPLGDLAPGFLMHLHEERGLRAVTIKGYEHHLRVFERFLRAERVADLSSLTPAILTRFLIESTARISAAGRQGRAGVLRVLLRYLHRQRILAADLSRTIPRGRTYRHATIPRAIPWSEVQRVLASVDRRSAAGKRDYAALLLLATYGLRSQEVAMLELPAIDWAGSRFHVLGRKAGNSTTYPLSSAVGEAIIDYLRNARPACADRHVFLTLSAPYRPLAHWAISTRASLHLRRAGVKVRRPGSHTFRHSCVQRLVEADVPFKQIGDYVGHRSEDATQVYAKVALHKLRALNLGEEEVL